MKYAQIDPTKSGQQPVLGFFLVQDSNDPSGFVYPALPPSNALVAMTQQQWDARTVNGWYDPTARAFISPVAPAATVASASAALAAKLAAAEIAGINFTPAGAGAAVLFPTDPASQIRYIAAWNALNASPSLAADGDPYLSASGAPVALSMLDAKAMLTKALNYFRACQANYAALFAAVQANPSADITVGWPANT